MLTPETIDIKINHDKIFSKENKDFKRIVNLQNLIKKENELKELCN